MALHLQLLGVTELRDASGRRFDAVLAQPKRLTLLAYLALHRPARLHRRDALLLLFWPESDEARARGALSQALAFLRRELGDGVIVTRGVDEVGVDPAVLTTDVERMEVAAEAGEHPRAVGLYHGPLLSGVHIDGCHELDEWLSAERRRTQAVAARSARVLWRQLIEKGEASLAVLAASKELLISPTDEGAAERVMRALEMANRRTVAIEEYEMFRRRLRDELGVEPSPALQAFAARLRAAGA